MIQSHAESIKKILEAGIKDSKDFLYNFSMPLYHKWDVKNGFVYVLQVFSLISDGLGGVLGFTTVVHRLVCKEICCSI